MEIDRARLSEYLAYHAAMLDRGDLDPAYPALRYVAERFELNPEQRYWLAFLYAACYCGATAFYILNEFPDWENVDAGRLQRWWAENRARLIFQTDRRWVRSRNQFCDMVASYTAVIGPGYTQRGAFWSLADSDPRAAYDACFAQFGRVYQMGRFALFLYLEAVHALTGFPMEPTGLDLRNAESSRNGLAFAVGRDDLVTHGVKRPLTREELAWLDGAFAEVLSEAKRLRPDGTTVWSVETSLCAYKKFTLGKRYLGYYLDRQADEIRKMQANVPEGVCWDVLWDFRRETFRPEHLSELFSHERA